MKTLFTIIDIILFVPSFFFASYLAFLTFFAIVRKPIRRPGAKFLRTFAILVPAHDEELMIEKTLTSISRINYPKDLFDVIVIADNCKDRTAEIADSQGVFVLERSDSLNKGKGQALRWCLDILLRTKKGYDGFVIIDADTVVSTNLLKVMNDYLEHGAECIQCSDLIVPQPGTWSSEITRVAFILHNFVRPLGKKVLKLSMGLNGNGMCFSRKLISAMPWSSYSRIEDLEHSLQLMLKGVKVQFAPEASVHAIMPEQTRAAETQRRRWEIARYSLIRHYVLPLISAAIRKRSLVAFDMLLELITPAFVNLFVFTTSMFFLNIISILLGATWLGTVPLLFGIVIILEIFHVLGGLAVAGADRETYLVLIKTPRYAIWKVKLYIKTLINGDDKDWLRTERSSHLGARN